MSKFEVLLLQPNVSGTGVSGIDKEYTEEALRNSVDSLSGTRVELGQQESGEPGYVVGEVTNAEYVEGEGVRCTVQLDDDDTEKLLEAGVANLAPKLFHETLETAGGKSIITEVEFDAIFTTPMTTEQVGDTTPI